MEFFKRYGFVGGVFGAVAVLAVALVVRFCGSGHGWGGDHEVAIVSMYDISYPDGKYELVDGEVGRGETMGTILDRYGIMPAQVHRIEVLSKDVFNLRNVRAGHPYVAFLEPVYVNDPDHPDDEPVIDSLARPRLAHFVYEKSLTDYFVISLGVDSLGRDSLVVRNGQKPVRVERNHIEAEIESSLWNAIVGAGRPAALAAELEDIFGWSVDFFGIQKGDSFEVIYDQRYVDSLPAGVGRVWGAVFKSDGKTHYAIPFRQDGKIAYWDENGNSQKKQFMKAPLKFYSRISSGYNPARRHPITRRVRPHLAIDYAAPSGTPVYAVADGTVSRKFWDRGGGGNSLFIKHARGYQTRYLHLRGYASGIAVGRRVKQGDVIGYVGSTGMSTGPHLDYQISVNGKPINPLRVPVEPGEPVKKANRAAFDEVKRRVMGELDGSLPADEWLVQLDSL